MSDGGFYARNAGERPGIVSVLNKYGLEPGQGSSQKSGGYFQFPDLVFDLPLTANEHLARWLLPYKQLNGVSRDEVFSLSCHRVSDQAFPISI